MPCGLRMANREFPSKGPDQCRNGSTRAAPISGRPLPPCWRRSVRRRSMSISLSRKSSPMSSRTATRRSSPIRKSSIASISRIWASRFQPKRSPRPNRPPRPRRWRRCGWRMSGSSRFMSASAPATLFSPIRSASNSAGAGMRSRRSGFMFRVARRAIRPRC